ncbi:MAG: hypothetical protein IJX33_03625 [Akkermansia sp.]|nr:hypothetical protein [Akkermansia sp.]
MNTERTYLNEPHARLAHLGCAGLVFLAALSGHLSLISHDLHLWLLAHHYLAPLLVLALLAAAYLLEHALTTTAMLALLLASAICSGAALAGFILPGTSAALIWQLLAGPAGYFSTVALALHFWAGRLYRWQLCCIFTAGALLLPWLVCPLTGAHPITTLCALGVGLTTATVELCVFFGRDYFEITSASRTRSTVICMVMLIVVPAYKVLWISLRGCYRGGAALWRFFGWWW